MCKWQAVNQIVIRAINAEKWTDEEIHDAMLRLAARRLTVTVNSLGNELDPPSRNPGPPNNVRPFPQAVNGSPSRFGPLDNVNQLWEGRR